MKMTVTILARTDAHDFDRTLPPGKDNPGGGLAEKVYNFGLALPMAQPISYANQIGDVNVTEALWFSGGDPSHDMFRNRIDEYRNAKAYKILWTSDLDILRWSGEQRDAIFDATDIIAGNSPYMVNILKTFAPHHKVGLLTDCIDPNSIKPLNKKRQLIGMSHVILEKNVDAVIEVYKLLKSIDFDISKGYIGSSEVWGVELDTHHAKIAKEIDLNLQTVCDWITPQATRKEVAETVGTSWGFIADSRFDTFCYALVEALLAGCYAFCGNHLIYNALPVVRFKTPEEAVERIIEMFDDDIVVNAEGRQYVIDTFSLDVFRRQFAELVGRNFV